MALDVGCQKLFIQPASTFKITGEDQFLVVKFEILH